MEFQLALDNGDFERVSQAFMFSTRYFGDLAGHFKLP